MRVLGIDPGLNITGYAVLEMTGSASRIVEAGTIRPPRREELGPRMSAIHTDLAALLAEHKPHRVAIEQLYSHASFPQTAVQMAYARGAVLLACHQAGVGVVSLAPNMVKKALTGNGHASKRQMQLAVQSVCCLDAPPSPPDVADAIAIALCAAKRLAGLSSLGSTSRRRAVRLTSEACA